MYQYEEFFLVQFGVFLHIELLSTYFNLPRLLTKCVEVLFTYFNLPQTSTIMILSVYLHLSSTQCDFGPCIKILMLFSYFISFLVVAHRIHHFLCCCCLGISGAQVFLQIHFCNPHYPSNAILLVPKYVE